MRDLIIVGLMLLSTSLIKGQTRAITETGDEVILYQNGTWKYENDSVIVEKEIKLNDKEFNKSNTSTFLVKSQKLNIGVWINPKEWSFSKANENEAAEFQFQKKNGDLYAMLISEKMQIPIESLRGIAFENAKSVAPDIKILKEEYRVVNGIKVFMMQMDGTIQGMRFIYYGYYYSSSNGTIQLLTYTGESLMEGYLKDVELFLNGLVEL